MLKDYDVSESGINNLIKTYFFQYINFEKLNNLFDNVSYDKEELINKLSSQIYLSVFKDISFIASLDPSQNNPELVLKTKTKGLIATMCYRIAHYFIKSNLIDDEEIKLIKCREFMEQVAVDTGVDIHPQASIDEEFFIDHAKNIVIGSTCIIGRRCNLFNDVVLGSKNVKTAQNIKRHPTLGNNVTVCAGARILGDIKLGDNVFVCPHAVVTDDIPDDTQVSVVNQIQLTKKINSLPSQKMTVFGVAPKFKNSIKILGEGFYNPTVLIKLNCAKTLNYQITYWDKNKILIKFKNKALSKDEVTGVKIIILCNADKVIVLNSYGLNKALTTLLD